MRGGLASALGVLHTLWLAACQGIVGDYSLEPPDTTTPPSPVVVTTLDTKALCELERQQFSFDIDVEDDRQLPKLESYYERANPGFVAHLQQLAELWSADAEHGGVTYLEGAAGVGKSFITGNALGAFPLEAQCEVNLPSMFLERANELEFEVVSTPDLTTVDGEIVFNELPNLSSAATFDLRQLLVAARCVDGDVSSPLVMLDGIDELHDAAARAILSAVDRFVLQEDYAPSRFFHIVVVGRPGGFASWLTDPARTERNTALVDRFDLVPPRYETAGALRFRALGYLEFSDQLDRLTADDQLEPFIARFQQAVIQHPFLTYSIGNLAVGNVVIDRTGNGNVDDELELKAGLFDDILLRNARSHGRPGAGSRRDAEYRRILEAIAVRYADVSASGTFAVGSGDTVEVIGDDGEQLGEVRVRHVLNRGGVAVLTNASSTATRYRFSPFWLQAHLIELYNERVDSGYAYTRCEADD